MIILYFIIIGSCHALQSINCRFVNLAIQVVYISHMHSEAPKSIRSMMPFWPIISGYGVTVLILSQLGLFPPLKSQEIRH